MKSIKKRILPFVLVACCFNMFSLSAFAATPASSGDLYAQEATEVVNIEGVVYTYHYYYNGDGNRTISITNDANSDAEIVIYDEATSMIFLNDEIVGMVSQDESLNSNMFQLDAGWEYIGSESHYVSWAKGIGAAAVAGVIAAGLSTLSLGAAGVIAIMGLTALGILSAGAVGGTVNMDFYRYMVLFGPTQHQCSWSFTASTGDYYGNYLYLY